MTINDAEALNRAADIIEDQGHVAGKDGTLVGATPKCALGAIGQAVGHDTFTNADGEVKYMIMASSAAPSAAVTFARYIMEKQANPWDEVSPPFVSMSYAWGFNDESTAEDVVAELRTCALIEEAKAEAEEMSAA